MTFDHLIGRTTNGHQCEGQPIFVVGKFWSVVKAKKYANKHEELGRRGVSWANWNKCVYVQETNNWKFEKPFKPEKKKMQRRDQGGEGLASSWLTWNRLFWNEYDEKSIDRQLILIFWKGTLTAINRIFSLSPGRKKNEQKLFKDTKVLKPRARKRRKPGKEASEVLANPEDCLPKTVMIVN